MKYVCLLVFFLMAGNAPSYAQIAGFEGIETLFSKVLNEERRYYIYVPEFKQGERLPVHVILDASINFSLYKGVQEYLTRGRVPMGDRAVLIGIINTDRTRDLTPTHINNSEDKVLQKGGDYSRSGGAEKFLRFIQQELLPVISVKYPISEERTLVGHSFGGLTVLYCLLNHPDYFSRYLAADPSLWWDNYYILGKAREWQLHAGHRKQLSVAFSGSADESGAQLQSAFANKENLDLRVISFPDENHGTVMLRAIPAFLKKGGKGK